MKKNDGFTLVEILVTIGILAIAATLMAQVLFTTTHVNKKTEILADIKQNGNFALDVIGRMVRSAMVIETSCDIGSTSTSSARIRNFDNNATILTCLSDGNAARIASVSATTGAIAYLSGDNVTLSVSSGTDCSDSSLTFSCPPADGGIQSQITVIFRLGQVGVSGSAYESGSATFGSTVGLRN